MLVAVKGNFLGKVQKEFIKDNKTCTNLVFKIVDDDVNVIECTSDVDYPDLKRFEDVMALVDIQEKQFNGRQYVKKQLKSIELCSKKN